MPTPNLTPQSNLQSKLPDRAKRFSLFLSPNNLIIFITLFLLAVLGWFEFSVVKQEMKHNLSVQLHAILSANVGSLRIWIKDQKRDAEVIAGQPEIREKIISLVAMANKKDVAANALRQTSEFKWLREHLGNVCKKYGFIDFVVFDSTGYQMAALWDDAFGNRKIIERSDFFYRSLQGDTVVSHPFPGEVDLPDGNGDWKPNRPTMFTSTPIRNNAGETVGVLAFRIRPEMDFSHVLEVSRFGKTGESFAFNDEGFLLTHSRFFDKIKEERLIAQDADATAILNVRLKDPHKNLNRKGISGKHKEPSWHLTRMAASSIQGKSDVNVDGYTSYHGKQVVGAWTWLPKHRFGVATEIEAREAFGSVLPILRVFSFLIAATVAAFILCLLQMRTKTERNLAQEHIKEREKEINSLAKFASENPNPVLRIGMDGKLLYANPPAFALLKDRALQVGDPISPEFQAVFANVLSSKSIQEIETKVGTQTFLLEWVPILNEGYVNIYGRDITERKKAEIKLRTQAKQQAALTKLGFIALTQSNLSELMDRAVHLFSRTLQVDYSKILKYIPEEQAFLLQAGQGWKEGLVGKARVPDEMGSQAGYTFRSNHPVIVRDLDRETRFTGPALLFEHGVVSGMSVIIPAGDQPFGVIGVHTKKMRIFTHDEINFLQSMANILANAIERKQAEEKLERKAGELQRSNQELEDFAFIASHDLQEPLRKVMLFGDRIKSVYPSNGDDQGKNYIDRLQKSMHKMQNFIHDLLEYSKVTRTSTPLKTVNLKDVVSESLNHLDAQIKRSQGTVEIFPLPFIKGDRFQLVQLFQNLISNALKYARENVPPQIKISSRPNGNSAWDILIEDNGIGMEPKYFHKIFKPFERLHSGDMYGGNGIGLAICSKVLTRHGGEIRIESQPGKGSTFIITLPKAQPAASRAIKETAWVSG